MTKWQIIATIIEDEPGFENHILELEKIYSAVENEKKLTHYQIQAALLRQPKH